MNGTPPQAALADRQSRTGPRYMLSLLIPVSKKESSEGQAASHRSPCCATVALLCYWVYFEMGHDVRAMFQILQYHNPLHFEYFEYRQGIIQREKAVIQKRFV